MAQGPCAASNGCGVCWTVALVCTFSLKLHAFISCDRQRLGQYQSSSWSLMDEWQAGLQLYKRDATNAGEVTANDVGGLAGL